MNRRFLASYICGVLCLLSGGLHAADMTGCDPQYLDAIEARGKIEASRENAQNQNLILKADSVLEYSCFMNDIDNVGSTFENTGALDSTVRFPTFDFVFANFGHTFLGGRTVASAAGGGTGCIAMAYVWQLAHCFNFFDRPAQDGFFDFGWYASNEPRQLPQTCTAMPVKNGDINIAYNNKAGMYVLSPENPNDAASYKTDNVVAHDVGTNCSSSPMVPTGIVVRRPGFTPESYKEKVCPYPGCYYYPTGLDTGECRDSP